MGRSSSPRPGSENQILYLADTQRGVTMYKSDDIVAYLEEHYG